MLELWRELDAFKTSMKLAEGRPVFSFFDGPPFATGLPHYGHILAGTIKDTVTRYASLNGYYVERRFGWDCHGLPVEYEIDKKLGISSKEDVLKMGIGNYNAECRAIVMRYSQEWEKVVGRCGRWIDFDNDFKTMYPSFMESVWWVFARLFERGQVYRGFRVMPFSTACSTPLSNFELAQNYRDIQDPSVVVSFPLDDDPDTALLVWTTTPWTLPANLQICVHPDMDYVFVRGHGTGTFVVLEARVASLFDAAQVAVVRRVKGSELEGLRYRRLFDFFASRQAAFPLTFTVAADPYVTDDVGTGLVHQAPAFGQEDFEVCKRYGTITETNVPCPIDERGRFTDPVDRYIGLYWKDANGPIIRDIEAMGRMFARSQVTHSYPHCWRSDTPLIYRTVPCWFVRVTNIIPQLLAATEATHWVPDHVQDKRFRNWISTAVDWAVSRNRYWGTPIPVWASDDYEELVCVGSVAELERLSGATGIADLHRESIDHITIPSQRGKGVLRRVEEVLDCWFESGTVPYASMHYPFENTEVFANSFPADFIGEGIDQTRGWFYVLVVLGTHLFGQAPFKHVIVNGLVLAGDGKKMSKRLKNYPEPSKILDQYGADALRMYLINSPVVRAENLRFKEEGVKNIVRDVLLPWYNSYRFLANQLDAFELEIGSKYRFDPQAEQQHDNVMDSWILSSFQTLLKTVHAEMAAFKLYAVLPPLLVFIESLTNWYIRFNRRRLKGEYGLQEMRVSLNVLFDVVYSLCIVMAPFTPFLAENLYQRLCPYTITADAEAGGSVHFLAYPKPHAQYIDSSIERAFALLQDVVERVRTIRESRTIPLKTPLKQVLFVCKDPVLRGDLESLRPFVLDELNVRCLDLTESEADFGVCFRAAPNFKSLGQRLKKDFVAVQAALRDLSPDALRGFFESGQMHVLGHLLEGDDIEVTRSVERVDPRYQVSCAKDYVVLLDITVDAALREEGLAREFVNRVQRLRKKAGLKPTDNVAIQVQLVSDPDDELRTTLDNQLDFITKSIRSALVLSDQLEAADESDIGSGTVKFAVLPCCP